MPREGAIIFRHLVGKLDGFETDKSSGRPYRYRICRPVS
jgi:hypothetical protein